MIYKVHVSTYWDRMCFIIKAENRAKAKYKAFKQMKERGLLSKGTNFYYFITIFLDYTEKAEVQEWNG